MPSEEPESEVERTQRMSARERALAERQTSSAQTVLARQIGPYQLFDELGRGSNGVVYLARKRGNEEPFALKVLLHAQDEQAVLRFRREAATTARLQAPGIVRTLDFGQDGARLYYVMEYCPGQTLKDRLRSGPLPPSEAAELVAALAEAIAAAHQFGVIHRDLKPSNVLLEEQSGRPRITDFGLARDYIQQRLTRTGDVLGTPVYMAPEQVHGRSDLDQRVDVYALGAMLYEVLSGRVPFYAPELRALAKQIQSGRVTPLSELVPGLSPALIRICAKAMATQREDRYATASALAADLREYLARAEPAPAPAPRPPEPEQGSGPPPIWAWGALGAAVLSSAVLVLVLALQPEAAGPTPAPTRELEEARAEGRAEAQREEVRRVLLEVELQEREGASHTVLMRQLTRVQALAEGEEAKALSAKIVALETRLQDLEEARAQLSDLERRNGLFAPLDELEPSLDRFAAAHPQEQLPADLAKRFSMLKKRVAGRSVLGDYVKSMSDPPSFEQLCGLLGKSAEWAPFNRPLSQEALQHLLRGTDALLATHKDNPTLLIFRGLVQYRLGAVQEAREAWRIVLSAYDHRSRRYLVHEFDEARLMTEAEREALRDVEHGR